MSKTVYLAVDEDGSESLYAEEPRRAPDECSGFWVSENYLFVPSGTIEKLIGYKLTWEDKPVEWTGKDVDSLNEIK